MENRKKIYKIVICGLMAAIIFVVTAYIRIPIGESKTNFANGISILAGLLFGPVTGGISAGLGSAISDVIYGYSPLDILITFVMKFAMAAAAGLVCRVKVPKKSYPRAVIATVCGAVLYIALYLLKTFLFQLAYGSAVPAAFAYLLTKLPGSLLNAAVAVVFAPILCEALRAPLSRIKMFGQIKK